MKKISLLGYGKIGKAISKGICEHQLWKIVFVQDSTLTDVKDVGFKIAKTSGEDLYEQVDLFIECANPEELDYNFCYPTIFAHFTDLI